ncbi:carbohydrate-binding protein [Streptomyces sp. TRM 70351]|uniref:carbohydrate-binding protein n=1 Tax=Streptomyces sp. TRM 70351 TaxID=3116552 RepID=UPI002E7B129B|nr:carbohydrate-binding protein [Streptomyces sp. TRM 70351]MEE1927339.1 carbohydrate-binding protein [Streptomyces sp. TRM 70351]
MEDTTTPAERAPGGISRKNVLRAALVALPVPALVGSTALARDARPDTAGQGLLTPTPMCDDGDDPTPEQMEGPYFRPDSPRRTSLLQPGTVGTRLTVSGYVFGRSCRPVPDVLLDFWQADANGAYDNTGYRFRGHQFSTARGAFTLETIVPGLYPGRTRHLHVKVQAPGRPVLTTQLYFPGEPRNNTDALYDPALLMQVRQNGSVREASFDVVLDLDQSPGDPGDPGDPGEPGGAWRAGTAYRAGDRVTYAGSGYRCLQAHTAHPGWEPPSVPALWRREAAAGR